jgi:hypothetical protein
MMGKGVLQSRAAFRHRVSSIVLAGALLAGTSVGASVIGGTGTAVAATVVDCSTTNLQTAIDNAPAGATLVVTGTCTNPKPLVGTFVIQQNLRLVGSGPAVLQGTANSTLFVEGSPVVTVAGLTITRGVLGGVVNQRGTLTLKDDVVSGNTDALAGGGGIDNEGTLIVDDSTVTQNAGVGGRGPADGGGIANGGSLTLHDSTVSDNLAIGPVGLPGQGGGIFSEGPATLDDSSVTGNTASQAGGGLFGGPYTLHDTIVSLNIPITAPLGLLARPL